MNPHKYQFILLLCILAFTSISYAEQEKNDEATTLPEVVVTATRYEEYLSKVPYAMDVITSEQIRNKNLNTLNDALGVIPGFMVMRGGTFGTPTLFSLRGSIGGHTLMLIDGIPISEPYVGVPDIDILTLFGFNRIEVMHGDQSVLYGSDAVSGVVNMITDPGLTPMTLGIKAGGGNLGYAQEELKFFGGDLSKAFFTGAQETDMRGHLKNDRFHSLHVAAFGRISPNEKVSMDLTTRIIDASKEMPEDIIYDEDQGQLRMVRELDRIIKTRTMLAGTNIEHKPLKFWRYKAFANYYGFEYDEQNDPTENSPHALNEVDIDIKSSRIMAGAQTTLNIFDVDKLTVGFDYKQEKSLPLLFTNYSQPPEQPSPEYVRENHAVYGFNHFDWKGWFQLAAGTRYTDNRSRESIFTSKANASVVIKPIGMRLFGGIGEGYKLPNLDQLFNPILGNTDLFPESSVNYEAGIEERLLKKLLIRSAWFYMEMSDLIEVDEVDVQFQNIDESVSKGVETKVELGPFWGLSAAGGHIYNEAINFDTGAFLNYRPLNVWQYNIDYRYDKWFFATIGGQTVGQRFDPLQLIDKNGELLKGNLDEFTSIYSSVNASVVHNWRLVRELRIFARIDNLLNSRYQEQRASDMPGTTFSAGAELLLF